MAAKPKFKSDLSEAIHSSASALFGVGAIDKATMREFDESCLSPWRRVECDHEASENTWRRIGRGANHCTGIYGGTNHFQSGETWLFDQLELKTGPPRKLKYIIFLQPAVSLDLTHDSPIR